MNSENEPADATAQTDRSAVVPPPPRLSVIVAVAMLAATLRPRRDGGKAVRRQPVVTWRVTSAKPSVTKADAEAGNAPSRHARKDRRDADVRLSQFYTDPAVAALMVAIFRDHFNPEHFLMVEPSAGQGAFSMLLPDGSLAFDVEPKHPGIEPGDFLEIAIESDLPIAMIGNPPFGRNSSLAKKFFDHAANQAMVIAMILPRTFRKSSIQNQLDRSFHLFREADVPSNAFVFRSKRQTVPAVFQIWIKGDQPRALWYTETSHRDFAFTDRDSADFAIRRIGVNAGRIYHNPTAKPDSFYFIRGDVEDVMSKLDLAGAARDVAGVPSLSKGEIVGLYDAWINRGAERN